MKQNQTFVKKLYESFQVLHENLAMSRNFVGCFSKICIDKMAEYKPNIDFEKEMKEYLIVVAKEGYPYDEEDFKEKLNNKFHELLKKHNITFAEYSKKIEEQISIGSKLGVVIKSLEDKVTFYAKSYKQIFSNSLDNMVMMFEEFLANVFKHYYEKYPSILNSRTIKFEHISSATSIEGVKNIFILNEIEELMHKSIKEIFELLMKTMSIDLPFFNSHKDKILEIFYRRNIFIHNRGAVNKTYISLSSNPYSFKNGEEALITEDYLYDSASLLLLSGVEIITSIISKIKLNKGEEYSEEENQISFIAFENYLCKEDWQFALEFYNILVTNSQLSEKARLLYDINIMLCKKYLGSITIDEIKKHISSDDTYLKIGYDALIEEFDELSILLIQYYKDVGGLTHKELETWPIFIEYRKTELYREVYKEIKDMEKKAPRIIG